MFRTNLPGEALAPPVSLSGFLEFLAVPFRPDPGVCSDCFGDFEGEPCPGCGEAIDEDYPDRARLLPCDDSDGFREVRP